ncbi:Ppx/GppA phosphatase family-domain-containing protein [Apiosordaria backusii]|uniref:Ppx/GppA phosphatase family-domain-containing protein n=1 Tax=Apiosordaria backusii TaxID=314023 RepID=A0AA40EZA1_9PEZI|nr:Ppx/GppA phosphatase family-domain-containing protein [Apiosordaria backusii]
MTSTVDIVTIENYREKLPRWDPNSKNHRYALVDMGSNGIRFSVSDLSRPRARLLKCLYRERAAISLFDALNGPSASAHGDHPLVFPDETIKQVSQTLARFRSIAVDIYDVPPSQLIVFATEAMRRAENAASMLEAIHAEAPDLSVHILAPQVETLFGAVGARSSFVDVKGLILDLGGGSVQMTWMDTSGTAGTAGTSGTQGHQDQIPPEVEAAVAGQSLPFGAARLIKILDTAHVDVQTSEKAKLQDGMAMAFQTLCAKFPSLAELAIEAKGKEGKDKTANGSSGIDIFLCGGGFRGYGSMLMHNNPIQPYPISSIGSYTASGKLFNKTKEMLRINKSFDGKIFGMSKRRRAQFPAIVAVVEALIAAVPPIRSATFCSGGNREGALMMMLPREVRDSNPLSLPDDGEASVPSGPAQVDRTLQEVLSTLQSAFPPSFNLTSVVSVFSLQLGPLYASHIWGRMGESEAANASSALHDAVNHADSPGLTHLARAVLAVTLCARWGANLGPIDQQLHQNLRELIDATDPDAAFWADYTGAVTAALAIVVPAWPKSSDTIKDRISFRSSAEHGKKYKLHLEITISKEASRGVDLDDIKDLFKSVGKHNHEKKKVAVKVNALP